MRQELAARDYSPSVRFRKRWNPVWISHFLNRTDGEKDPLPSRIVQSFLKYDKIMPKQKKVVFQGAPA